jgi:prepilin-type N-terminal cleavage/methylation domain-containing protein
MEYGSIGVQGIGRACAPTTHYSITPILHYSNRSRAYTLIEMLIALIMFALISAATGFALTAGIRGQQAIGDHMDELTEARTLLGTITRDLRCAYASAANPYTFFVASGSSNGTILTFTSANYRIRAASPTTATTTDATAVPSYGPQSDIGVVNYSFDPDRHIFSRTTTPMPNPDALPDPSDPNSILSKHVRAITFSFLDPNTGSRMDWNFTVDPNANSTSTTGASTAQGQQQTQQQSQSQSGDTTLPTAVQVSLDLITMSGRPATYTTTVTLMTPQPQPAGQKPPAPAATTGTGTQSGQRPGGNTGGPGQGGGPGGPGGGGTPRPLPGGGLPGMPGMPGMPGAGGARP